MVRGALCVGYGHWAKLANWLYASVRDKRLGYTTERGAVSKVSLSMLSTAKHPCLIGSWAPLSGKDAVVILRSALEKHLVANRKTLLGFV